jgi:hypothetical protein
MVSCFAYLLLILGSLPSLITKLLSRLLFENFLSSNSRFYLALSIFDDAFPLVMVDKLTLGVANTGCFRTSSSNALIVALPFSILSILSSLKSLEALLTIILDGKGRGY